MKLCHVCGNAIEPGLRACPFCASPLEVEQNRPVSRPFAHRTVNIEAGRPQVEQALSHLQVAIDEARRLDVRVMTIIHGYGSSGEGGAIRTEARKVLEYLYSQGKLQGVIIGEEFHRRNGRVRDLLRRFPQLAANANYNRANRGITLAVL